MEKIYSRNRRIHIPKFNGYKLPNNNKFNNKIHKASKASIILIVAIITASFIVKAITPVIDKECINMAKSVATKISNEQASIIMEKCKYEDLCIVSKDSNRKYYND